MSSSNFLESNEKNTQHQPTPTNPNSQPASISSHAQEIASHRAAAYANLCTPASSSTPPILLTQSEEEEEKSRRLAHRKFTFYPNPSTNPDSTPSTRIPTCRGRKRTISFSAEYAATHPRCPAHSKDQKDEGVDVEFRHGRAPSPYPTPHLESRDSGSGSSSASSIVNTQQRSSPKRASSPYVGSQSSHSMSDSNPDLDAGTCYFCGDVVIRSGLGPSGMECVECGTPHIPWYMGDGSWRERDC